MSDRDSRLNQCFLAVFPDADLAALPTATVDSIEAWDSVTMVSLLTLVGEEFSIEIDWENTDQLTSYAAIAEMLQARLGS